MNDRERQKLSLIMKTMSDQIRDLAKVRDSDPFGVLTLQIRLMYESKIGAISATPASHFKKDKPEIDKRRARKGQKVRKIYAIRLR